MLWIDLKLGSLEFRCKREGVFFLKKVGFAKEENQNREGILSYHPGS